MMKTKIKVSKTSSHPSSFLDTITVEGDVATIKMKNRATLYHYHLTPDIRKALKSIDEGISAGTVYNKYFRGKSFAKTIYKD